MCQWLPHVNKAWVVKAERRRWQMDWPDGLAIGGDVGLTEPIFSLGIVFAGSFNRVS